MKKFFALLLIFAILMPPVVHAEDIWTMAESDQYGRKAGGMFVRGIINAATCWVDLLAQAVDKSKSGPPFFGTLQGIATGAGCTVLRAASGVVDVAGFWVPGFNGFPVCKSYLDCVNCAPKMEPVPVMEAPQPVMMEAPAPVQEESPMKYVKK